ncbi:MAG: alpha/beta hydrolase [Bacteroidota bacterium]
MKLYLVSGLGADQRVFEHLRIPGVTTHLIEWLPPHKHEPLPSYAARLLAQVEETGPIHLLGVSFGGIVAQEMARIRTCNTLIIISSVKSRTEYRVLLKLGRFLRIDKIVPGAVQKWIASIIGPFFFGLSNAKEKKMLRSIIQETDLQFLAWAIDNIMNWEGNYQQEIYHIHGTADRIFPVGKIDRYEPIENGGHLMIFNRAEEVNRLVGAALGREGEQSE